MRSQKAWGPSCTCFRISESCRARSPQGHIALPPPPRLCSKQWPPATGGGRQVPAQTGTAREGQIHSSRQSENQIRGQQLHSPRQSENQIPGLQHGRTQIPHGVRATITARASASALPRKRSPGLPLRLSCVCVSEQPLCATPGGSEAPGRGRRQGPDVSLSFWAEALSRSLCTSEPPRSDRSKKDNPTPLRPEPECTQRCCLLAPLFFDKRALPRRCVACPRR